MFYSSLCLMAKDLHLYSRHGEGNEHKNLDKTAGYYLLFTSIFIHLIHFTHDEQSLRRVCAL